MKTPAKNDASGGFNLDVDRNAIVICNLDQDPDQDLDLDPDQEKAPDPGKEKAPDPDQDLAPDLHQDPDPDRENLLRRDLITSLRQMIQLSAFAHTMPPEAIERQTILYPTKRQSHIRS
jgi:hypothetical protein